MSLTAQKGWESYYDERDSLYILMQKINQRAERHGYEEIDSMALSPDNRTQWWFEDNTVSRQEKEEFYEAVKEQAQLIFGTEKFHQFFKQRKYYLDRINEMGKNLSRYDDKLQNAFKLWFLLPDEHWRGEGWGNRPYAEHPRKLTLKMLSDRWYEVEKKIKEIELKRKEAEDDAKKQKIGETNPQSNALIFANFFDSASWNSTK